MTAGAYMPKLTTNDILTALLTGKPVAPRQEPKGVETPSDPPEPVERPKRRKLGQSQARAAHERWQGREAQREARARAEEWLQALREWHIRGRTEYISSRNLYSNRPPADGPRVVGQYTSGGSQAVLQYREISTPIGWVSEKRVAALCNADPLLNEIRAGRGLATLTHASGRGWAGDKAREYGLALLEFATALGDDQARHLLPVLVLAED